MKTILSVGTDEATQLIIRDTLPFYKHFWAKSFSSAAEETETCFPDIVLTQLHSFEGSVNSMISCYTERYADPAPLVIISPPEPLTTSVELSSLASVTFLPLPLNRTELKRIILNLTNSFSENKAEEETPEKKAISSCFVGRSKSIQKVKHLIQTFAPHEEPVLITGDTGTGKEIVAKLLHDLSRKEQPFSSINCSAIPPEIVESTLFGHKKGSFTGAHRDHKGFFETSKGGTLFLDEIGEMDSFIQPKLLRVLETKTVFPVGDTKHVPVNLRIVSATNRHIKTLTNQGKFRADLFFRINTLQIHIPPLKKRPEDIPLLVHHFLQDAPHIRVTEGAMHFLQEYHWPGNVRELINILARIRILYGHSSRGIVHITKQQFKNAFACIFENM